MKRNSVIFVLSFVVLSFSLPASGFPYSSKQEAPLGGISGIVTEAQSSMPVRDALVELTRDLLFTGLSATTDKSGRYTVANVPAGTYDLHILKPDYVPRVIPGVVVKEREVESDVNAALIPAGRLTPIRVGEKPRDFTLSTIDGKRFNLASFKGDNIVVLGVGNPYG